MLMSQLLAACSLRAVAHAHQRPAPSEKPSVTPTTMLLHQTCGTGRAWTLWGLASRGAVETRQRSLPSCFDLDVVDSPAWVRLTLGALHRYGVVLVHLYRHARGDRDRKSADSRHCLNYLHCVSALTRRRRALRRRLRLLAGFFIGHHALGRGDDGDAQAAQNLGQLFGLGVHAQAGLGDALQDP